MQHKNAHHDLHRWFVTLHLQIQFISHLLQNAHQYRHLAPCFQVRVSSSSEEGERVVGLIWEHFCPSELIWEHFSPSVLTMHHKVRGLC
jgi:hypothetical protein